jgi:hypothetical protein
MVTAAHGFHSLLKIVHIKKRKNEKRKVLVIPHFCNIHYTKSWGEIQWGIDIKRLIILHKKMGVYG